MRVQRLNKILLYDEGTAQALNVEEIAEYLRKKLAKVGVEVRGDPFALYLSQNKISDYATRIASIKIQDATRRMVFGQEPLYGEIEYEKKGFWEKREPLESYTMDWNCKGSFGSSYQGRSIALGLFTSSLPIVCLLPGWRATEDTTQERASMVCPRLSQRRES